MIRILSTTLLLVALGTGCSTVPRNFSPQPFIPPQDFSHTAFEHVVKTHVKDGYVHYPNVAEDRNFSTYLDQLNHVAPTQLPTPNHRLAFWINAYNAFAIKGILEGLSPNSFTGRYTYFVSQQYAVGGQSLNLYDLERKLLIPDYREPRIHFAIVCASQSCPKLRSWAYTAAHLDEQLTNSARQFINDPSRNHFDQELKIAYLSKIFDWFTEDFVNHSGSLTAYIAQFIQDPDLAKDLQAHPYQIKFLEYDWNLNGQPPWGTTPALPTSLSSHPLPSDRAVAKS